MAGIAYLSPPLSGSDSEKVFIELVSLLFHPLVAGVLLAAILAAIMSTADSQLLVASAALTKDFYKGLWRPQAREAELVWLNRTAVVLVAAVAIALAWSPENKVLELVAYAWAGFGAAFGPTLVLALYWRRMTRNGALAGILCGGLTVIVWKQLEGGLFELYEIIPGVLLSTLGALLVSVLDRTPDSAVVGLYDRFEKRIKSLT
jgi:sodium/proline symporter